jgi:dTDP-4-amino-4,6-dideoxygalactose transaminase
MGRKQLAKIDDIVDERNLIRDEYISNLEPIGFKAQKLGTDVRYNVQSMVFSVPLGCNRNHLISALKERGVESTIGTYAMSAATYYTCKYKVDNIVSSWLQANTITLPCYAQVDAHRVIDSVRCVIG